MSPKEYNVAAILSLLFMVPTISMIIIIIIVIKALPGHSRNLPYVPCPAPRTLPLVVFSSKKNHPKSLPKAG
jgi:hypothetical protein